MGVEPQALINYTHRVISHAVFRLTILTNFVWFFAGFIEDEMDEARFRCVGLKMSSSRRHVDENRFVDNRGTNRDVIARWNLLREWPVAR